MPGYQQSMNNNNTPGPSWANFWTSNPAGFNTVMSQATHFFATQLEKEWPVLSSDRIMDLGCGPGFLEDQISGKAEKVLGIDISETYVNSCKSKGYPDTEFLTVKPFDNETYVNLVKVNRINKVIMLSVLQYYANEQDVKTFLAALAPVGCTQPLSLLIADVIPKQHSFLQDFKSLLSYAVRKRYLFSLFRFMVYVVFSKYRKLNKQGILELDPNFFIQLGLELNIKVDIKKNLTIHSERYSVLLDFSSGMNPV